MVLDQVLTVSDILLSICSQNDTSSNGKSKYSVSKIIDSKKEAVCPRDADGHKLSPYELYHLSKIEWNHSYLKKLGFDCGSVLNEATARKKRKNKVDSKRQESKGLMHSKGKANITTASNKVVWRGNPFA